MAECTQRWGAVVIVAVVAAAAPFIAQVPQMTTTADFSAMVPRGATASVAFDSLIDDFGSGALAPYQLLLHPAPGAKIASQDFFRAANHLLRYLANQTAASTGRPVLNLSSVAAVTGCYDCYLNLTEAAADLPPSASWWRRELSGLDGWEPLPYELYACALHGCGGLNVSGAPWAQLRYLWGMQVSADNTTMALTLRLPIDPFSHAGTRWLGDFRAAITAAQAEADVEYVRAVAPIDLPRIALALGAANVLDAEAAVMATLPLMAGVTLGVVFILVTAAFRSLVVPLRAVLSISLTLAWVYGFLVAVYQHGLLVWTGIPAFQPAPQGLSWMTPVLSFAVMVGLGLDYDVFLLTRIYEERTNGMGDRASIVRGLVHSGNIITAAGCIMAIAFTGLLINATPALNQLAAALVASVLLDTFVVRTLLLPSVMGLLGSWNWWPRRMPPVALGVDWATRASVAEGDAGAAPAPADAARPINDA